MIAIFKPFIFQSSKSENTSWCSLLKSIKEEVIAQVIFTFLTSKSFNLM